MEQFVLPLNRFDLALLPEAARDIASPAFRHAVDDYFRRQFRDMGVNGVVQVTPETLTVGWVAPRFDPVTAAIALCQRGQVRDGVQLLELARHRRTDAPDLLLNLGIALNELAEHRRAIPILERLLELEPDHVRGSVALGVAKGRTGDTAAALECFTRAVACDPADPWAQLNLGGILLRMGRPSEARAHLEVAVQLNPNDAQSWLLLGEAAAVQDDTAAARQALGRARTLDPHGPVGSHAERAWIRLGIDPLPQDADGLNPDALAAMRWAIHHLQTLPPANAQRLTLQAAILGQHGLSLTDPARIHRLEGLAEPLAALQVACLIHAGLQMAAPGTPSGFPLEQEFMRARADTH
ncbi:MAG: tetratricopeptide repeat protein [Verrucomicrobiota bacterium]